MVLQVKTKSVSLRSVMHRAPFVRGFKEARKGIPMDYDAYLDERTNDRWQYERGRLFGLMYTGKLKDGNRVCYDAINSFSDAVSRGIILQ